MGKMEERAFLTMIPETGERLEERCKRWIKSFVCVCVPWMQMSVESNGVCVTLVKQVNGTAEISVLCTWRLVKLCPTCIIPSPLLH